MSKKLAALFAAVALVGATPTYASPVHAPVAVAAKTCSRGFTHAVIGGAEKCLRRGQFCAKAQDSQYKRYGFRCVKRDARGNHHLT